MGGTVPLGYDAIDRKLVINPREADTVRLIFAKFAETKSVQATLRWAQQQNLQTKVRQRLGKTIGGALYHYGALRCVLGNRTYVGDVEHKGKLYPGQHLAIVERELFDTAQAIFATLSTESMRGPKLVSASLLQGLILDCHGRTMGPVHTTRSGQRFRYYVTHPKAIGDQGASPYRLSANELERRCLELLAEHIALQVSSIDGHAAANKLAELLRAGSPREKRELVIDRVRKIIVGDGVLTIELVDGHKLQRSIERVRHGNDAKLIVGNLAKSARPTPNPPLIILLKDAHGARALALSKRGLLLEQLAVKFGRSTERYKRLLRLSYLSPTIIAAILESRQPTHLTNRFLQNFDGLPLSWAAQEQLLLG